MNCETSFPPIDEDLAWASAMLELNTWRGRWLQCFAGAEGAVTETLLALKSVSGRGDAVRLRHLSGQRMEDLAALLCEGGSFAAEGASSAKAIAAFRSHEELRNMLAHGHAKIALERTGEWLAVFRMTAIRSEQPRKVEIVIEQADARRLLHDVHRTAQSLTSRLANLRKSIADQSIGT